MKKIVIVGGGFGGIRAALELAKSNKEINIKLISDKPHFEYHPALYRVVSGKSPLEVCIPLEEIFKNKPVELCEDRIKEVDLTEKVIYGKDRMSYRYDYLILSLGSQTNYFNIPGIKELSFGFKSIKSALRLKNHLHDVFEKASRDGSNNKNILHVVIVGGGASGVELAADLSIYTKLLCRNHRVSEKRVKIELIEAEDTLVSKLPVDIGKKIQQRLEKLGVLIFLNEKLIKEDFEKVYIESRMIETKTLIWTAGVSPNSLYKDTSGLKFDPSGKVSVNEYLQAEGLKNVYILGDGASTEYSGMGQTADYDGKFAAKNILNSLSTLKFVKYVPKLPAYAIPLGKGWAAVKIGNFNVYGFIGWLIRKAADLHYLLTILPAEKALLTFAEQGKICESCSICLPVQTTEETESRKIEVIESIT